jgi:hypothetical protein
MVCDLTDALHQIKFRPKIDLFVVKNGFAVKFKHN